VYLARFPYLRENFGNALSPYELGTIAREAIEAAREEVAKLLNASLKEVIFTSGGTESNNFALRGLAYANRKKKPYPSFHCLTSLRYQPSKNS
jgi:Cysteine sulfinate desulfinase/cysteine desulfurase and related enzymes